MTSCAARRSRPTLFIAIVALSAVAFLGQVLAASVGSDATAVAAYAATIGTSR